jgi:hypothetical protein
LRKGGHPPVNPGGWGPSSPAAALWPVVATNSQDNAASSGKVNAMDGDAPIQSGGIDSSGDNGTDAYIGGNADKAAAATTIEEMDGPINEGYVHGASH